jgi:hypothetical protein
LTKPRWWTVRPAQNRKPATYTCPFCRRYLPALSAHALVAPEGDTAHRRHAHTQCVMRERKAGRLPTRDEWQATQPKPERTGWMARLFGARRPQSRD